MLDANFWEWFLIGALIPIVIRLSIVTWNRVPYIAGGRHPVPGSGRKPTVGPQTPSGGSAARKKPTSAKEQTMEEAIYEFTVTGTSFEDCRNRAREEAQKFFGERLFTLTSQRAEQGLYGPYKMRVVASEISVRKFGEL
jgi:hypothetical protein